MYINFMYWHVAYAETRPSPNVYFAFMSVSYASIYKKFSEKLLTCCSFHFGLFGSLANDTSKCGHTGGFLLVGAFFVRSCMNLHEYASFSIGRVYLFI
jgi:hypothetical protein